MNDAEVWDRFLAGHYFWNPKDITELHRIYESIMNDGTVRNVIATGYIQDIVRITRNCD